MFFADDLGAVPVPLVQIEQAETGEVAHGDGYAAGTVIDPERQKRNGVLKLKDVGEQRMEDRVVDGCIGRPVHLQKQSVPEEGHLPVVVVKSGSGTFADTVA